MNNNNTMVDVINGIVSTVDAVLLDQMGLVPPEQYDVNKREGRIYVTATFDPMLIGRQLKTYEHPDTLRVVQHALGGLPVVFIQKSGFRYVILASGKLNLPRSMEFPGFGAADKFRLGVCLRGEVAPIASRLGNVLIGANQGAGKSNVEKLLVHQARAAGWKLYICDPDGHTFNPDVWNGIAAAPVASSPDELETLIDRIYEEIADRAILFRQIAQGSIPPADIDAYNAQAEKSNGTIRPLQRILLSVDEANSYMSNKQIFKKLADLLRRGRKWGLHIFLAGHEWHKEVVSAEVNDMLQTRIGLTTANEETSQVVLRSRRWGKWVMNKPAGRGVIRIDQYQPMQFYLITDEMERAWLSSSVTSLNSPLSEEERNLVRRSRDEAGGKMTLGILTGWGVGSNEARTLVETWELNGWLVKDPKQGNARVITPKLLDLANLAVFASNHQTAQTASNPEKAQQTAIKPPQTLDFGGATI